MEEISYLENILENVPTVLFRILVLLVVWIVASYVLRGLMKGWLKPFVLKTQMGSSRSPKERLQRTKTILGVVQTTIMVGLGVALLISGLSTLGVEVAPLIAGAGIAGLAIGFGAQSLVKDVINGLFILMEDQFGLGDVVRVGLVTGKVEEFNLRRTVLRDLDGIRHHIPNSQIMVLSNLTKGWSGVSLILGVSQEADINQVMKILNKEFLKFFQDDEFKTILTEAPEVKGIEELTASAVKLQIIAKTEEGEQWKVKRALLLRIKQAFDKAGIKLA